MFNIAICDDEPEVCRLLGDMVHQITELPPIEVHLFLTGESLYEAVSEGNSYFDLYILDIELKTMSGVQLGTALREIIGDAGPQILFISANQGYAMDLFDLRPLHFLIKPLDRNKVRECVKKAYALTAHASQLFEFRYRQCVYRLPLHSIRYFESQGKSTLIHSSQEDAVAAMRLRDVLDTTPPLPPSFIQTHQSLIVNFDYVFRQQYDKVVLDDGTVLPISYSYRKYVRERLLVLSRPTSEVE